MAAITFIHTSDWHLGKKLFKRERIDEQKLFLDWLFNLVKAQAVDFLIISGDIFDVPIPPNFASKLYYDFLYKINEETQTQVIIIAGNHDSSSYLEAPRELLKKHNVYIQSKLAPKLEDNILHLETVSGDEILIKTLPYFRTHELYNCIKAAKSESKKTDVQSDDRPEEKIDITNISIIEDYLKTFFSSWGTKDKENIPKILMAHHAFGDFLNAGSEQALSLSGLDTIPMEWVGDQFNYMALGHIHKYQKMSKTKNIYYPGSPIPLRFSESQGKYINLVKVEGVTETEVTKISIPVFRSIIQINTDENSYLQDIEQSLSTSENKDLTGFIEVKCQLTDPKSGLADEIKELAGKYDFELLSMIPIYTNEEDENSTEAPGTDALNYNIVELFENYYKVKHPQAEEIPSHILSEFKSLLEEVNNEN